jgi:hypothetical protein
MLAAPLLVGAVAAGLRWSHLLLAVFWTLGYFAFFATGLWLKSHRKARYLPPVRAYGLATVVAGVAVLAVQPGLARWAPLFVPPLVVGLVASAQRQDRALASGVATAAGSCLMAPVAYDLGGGADWQRAWLMAAVLGAYFAGTVFYVKNLIRERDSQLHYWLSVGFHAAVTIAMVAVSPWAAALFAVLTARAAIVPRLRPSPKQAGIGEIAGTVLAVLVALLTV